MFLEEYIDKYRRGHAALTYAEAMIAGLGYPMPTGWFKRNRLLVVDEVAMREALKARRAATTRRPGKETKAEKRTRRALGTQPRQPAMVVSISVEVSLVPIDDERRAYVNSPAFLASFEWRQLRFKALQKYGRRCQCCGASPGSGAVMNVDHVKSRRRFPELALDIGNLQVLCEDCNHGKGNETIDFRAA